MESRATPGSDGVIPVHQPRQGVGSRPIAEQHRFEDRLELLLQSPAAVCARKGPSQFGGAGIAFLPQFQGDVKGQGGAGHVVEVAGIGTGVGAVDRRQAQSGQMLAEGPFGQQHRFAQQGDRVVVLQGHQPSLQGQIRPRHGQIPQAVNGGLGQVQIQRAVGLARLTQQSCQGNQLFHQGQLVLEAFECRRQGAAFGLALGQGIEGVGCRTGHRFDHAAAEAVVLQLACRVELQGYREGRLGFAHLEGAGLSQGRTEQGQPFPPHAEGIGLLPQPDVEGAARGVALADGRTVQPQGPAPFPLLQAQGWQAGGLLTCPGLQQQGRLVSEVRAVFGRQGLEGGPRCLGPGVEPVFGEQ